MKYVPHWITDALLSKRFKCHHCDKVLTTKDLTALGVRNSFSNPSKEACYIELACKECKKITVFELQEMNVIEFSEDVLDEIDADLDAMENAGLDAMEEYDEMEMGTGNKNNKNRKESGKKQETNKSDDAPKKIENSKITLKDIREVVKALKPKDLKHESFLEMLGMTPEEIFPYKEIE